jgi:hypothetical protein
VGETTFSGVFLRLLSLGPLAGRTEIDDISHAWSGLSKDACFPAVAGHLIFANYDYKVSGKP